MQFSYQPIVGPPVLLDGIFDAQYVLSQGNAEAGVETLVPAVFLSRTEQAKLPVEPEFDEPTMVIHGVTYRVTNRIDAGLGAIVLVLRSVV